MERLSIGFALRHRRLALPGGFVAALLLICNGQASASQAGRDGFSGNPATNGGATCNACHAPGATRPTVTLTGPQALDAGTIAEYSLTITGGPAITGGVGVSSSAIGTLSAVDGSLHVVGTEVSHTAPKAFSGNSVNFRFRYRAPSYNTVVTLFAAGNSSNGQLNLLGDGINVTQFPITIRNGGPPPPPPPPPAPTSARLVPLLSGLERPIAIEHAGDDRLFIAEQPGRIRVLNPDRTLRTLPLLDITDRVYDVNNEQGLLGLAFDPDYASNGRFYVNYIFHPGGLDRTRISRFVADPGGNTASAASEVVLMEFAQPFVNHNGGDIHFGPDGYLYIASGDGGSAGDPQNNAQNPNTPLGKLLRIDVNGTGGAPDCNLVTANLYGTPPDNAFDDGDGGAGCDEIFALGLRNPWRFGFDRATGDLWIADVGQGEFEEVDFVPAGTSAGLNFGWRCREGASEYNMTGCSGSYFEPLVSPSHAAGNCSITGGRVYRGVREPALAGRYFFSDFCNSAIRTIRRRNGQVLVGNAIAAGQLSQPSTFGEDVDGELYVASLTGAIYRIRSSAASVVTQFTVSTPDNDCLIPSGGLTAAGTPVVAPRCGFRQRQRWQLRDDGSLFNHASGRCLTVPNGNTTPGAVQLVIQNCAASAAQHFTPTGHDELKSVAGLCVEESTTIPDRVQLGLCNGGQHQRWFFNAVLATGAVTPRPIPRQVTTGTVTPRPIPRPVVPGRHAGARQDPR